MGLVRIAEPQSLAVDLSMAKEYCEISPNDTSHDDKMKMLVRAATANVEHYTRRALINQTWRLSISDFPCLLELPRPPLVSVQSIIFRDYHGINRTLNLSAYEVTTDRSPGAVVPVGGGRWPSVQSGGLESVQITYIAGYGDSHSCIPDAFKTAIYELVAFRFMNRGDVEVDIPRHIKWQLRDLHCGTKFGYYRID